MSQPTHIKSFIAPAAIAGRLLVTFGSADGEVVAASAVSDTLLGVSEQIGSRDNDRVDVVMGGVCEVSCGGNVTRGDILTANASGQAVTSGAGTDRIAGIAMQNGVAGDVIDILITQG